MAKEIKTMKQKSVESAKSISDTLVVYTAQDFLPNEENHRLVGVKAESLERLNSAMSRTYDGNSQIFETMLFKDQSRIELIGQFWKDMIRSPYYQNLPEVLKQLEFEQIRKVGPKSRWSEKKLREGFSDHVSLKNKHRCTFIPLFEQAKDVLVKYWTFVLRQSPDLDKYLSKLGNIESARLDLPNDSNSGDPYFISVDKDVAGVEVNQLDERLASQLVKNSLNKTLYYTMFKRTQAKGNNLFSDDGTFNPNVTDPWLPEKNRVVQGDSRAFAMLGKGIANLFTKVLPHIDPIMAAWADDEYLNKACSNMLNTYSNSYDFKSFDAENYDATTDPELFKLAMHCIFEVVESVGGIVPVPKDKWIEHFIYDHTITPWGIYRRISLPSGHIWTNLVGTVTNHLRNLVQTARVMNISVPDMFPILIQNIRSYTPLMLALGDDAVQLVKKGTSPDESSEVDLADGFGSNSSKTIISSGYFHFLQKGFDLDSQIYGYYPVSRALESILFQEYANQYTAALVSVNAISVINNCKYNPLQSYLIKFVMKGDPKYRLGSNIGFKRLFKLASQSGTSLAKLLDRDWDPKYSGKTYQEFGDGIRDTLSAIRRVAGKFHFK